jgi:hypothetical protein
LLLFIFALFLCGNEAFINLLHSHLDLAFLKFLIDICSIKLFNLILLSNFGYFLRSLWNESLLDLELVAVLNEMLTRVNFLLIWIWSVLDFIFLFGNSVFLFVNGLLHSLLLVDHALDPSDLVILELKL